jgi:outer membrane protein OmpA-like peptidoglycan-associated protein
MRRRVLRCLGGTLVALLAGTAGARAGEPVIGLDVGAALPIGTFQRTADPGGAFMPFVGYQIGEKFAFTPIVQPFFIAFSTDVERDRDSNVTSLLGVTAGGRLSWFEEGKEIYFSAQGGWYSDVTGPVNDKGEGFNIAGGFNYDLSEGTALGLFIRRDQSSMRAARDSTNDLTFLVTGLSFRHRFLPPPPAPAPEVAAAPPPPVPAPAPKRRIVLRGVHFDFDKTEIRSDAAPILDTAAQTLQEESEITVSVEGHTDAVGGEEYNQGLSVRRAKAVRDYLVEKGVDASRMSVEGFGESRPVASNDTADGRAQNRRVELRVAE